jgi:cob(I)alamin adenosyltransferase
LELKGGLVQVYTGCGKGKTTAALGQALRSVGCGLKVYMVQFLKTDHTGELESAKRLYPEFQIFRFEKEKGFFWTLDAEEKIQLKQEVNEALEFCKKVSTSQECDVLIMDEIMAALTNKLIEVDELIELIKDKSPNIELILTGRDAPSGIIEIADLVTEMGEVKHYFNKDIPARYGIEY